MGAAKRTGASKSKGKSPEQLVAEAKDKLLAKLQKGKPLTAAQWKLGKTHEAHASDAAEALVAEGRAHRHRDGGGTLWLGARPPVEMSGEGVLARLEKAKGKGATESAAAKNALEVDALAALVADGRVVRHEAGKLFSPEHAPPTREELVALAEESLLEALAEGPGKLPQSVLAPALRPVHGQALEQLLAAGRIHLHDPKQKVFGLEPPTLVQRLEKKEAEALERIVAAAQRLGREHVTRAALVAFLEGNARAPAPRGDSGARSPNLDLGQLGEWFEEARRERAPLNTARLATVAERRMSSNSKWVDVFF